MYSNPPEGDCLDRDRTSSHSSAAQTASTAYANSPEPARLSHGPVVSPLRPIRCFPPKPSRFLFPAAAGPIMDRFGAGRVANRARFQVSLLDRPPLPGVSAGVTFPSLFSVRCYRVDRDQTQDDQ